MKHDQEIRYSRNLSLPEIGKEGQEKLLAAKVLAIGAGGLGSPALLYLAAAGVGTIGVVDDDRVELSNLQRQIIYETCEVGQKKAESARYAMLDLNPDIKVNAHQIRLDESNIESIIADYDIILDGSDNFETRFLVNDYCYKNSKILISAAIEGFSGQLATFKAHLGDPHPCYRCFHPKPPAKGTARNCSESGVIGGVAGLMGVWQSIEVIKEILEIGQSLSGSIIIFDALSGTSRKVKIRRDKNCPCH